MKSAALAGAFAASGRNICPRASGMANQGELDLENFDLTELFEPVEAALAQMELNVPMVSDVDAHSMQHNIPPLRELFPENLLELNPETAAELAIKEGDTVAISTPRGSIQCKATITEGIDPRVVQLYHGFEDADCNVLTDNTAYDPITGSTGLKSLLCKVEKV